MVVTADEFKTNLGRYLDTVTEQDVLVTKNDKNVARLTSPTMDKLAILDSLAGIVPANPSVDEETTRDERLTRQRESRLP